MDISSVVVQVIDIYATGLMIIAGIAILWGIKHGVSMFATSSQEAYDLSNLQTETSYPESSEVHYYHSVEWDELYDVSFGPDGELFDEFGNSIDELGDRYDESGEQVYSFKEGWL